MVCKPTNKQLRNEGRKKKGRKEEREEERKKERKKERKQGKSNQFKHQHHYHLILFNDSENDIKHGQGIALHCI